MNAQMTFKLNTPLLNNQEVTVHKIVQYYSGNNTVAHMQYTNTQSNNTLHNKTIQNYIVLWVKSELPRNSGVSFSPFSGTKL